LGTAAQTSAALLLYTTEGLLAAAGMLVSVVLAGVAAGLWAGWPGGRGRAGWRWVLAVLSFGLAAVFAALWDATPGLRAAAVGRVLPAPAAYAAGALRAALTAGGARGHDGGSAAAGVALGMLLGAAAGVVLAAGTRSPHFDPGPVLLGCGLAATGGAALHAALGPETDGGGGVMQGKVVLITGVGRRGQVGYALAEAFLAEGARLVVTS